MKAYRSLRLWRRESTFSTWLFAVATNVYRSQMRRIVPPSVSIDRLAEIADPRNGEPPIERSDRARTAESTALDSVFGAGLAGGVVKLDDLDRALSESREIRVSGGFAASVMAAVRTEAEAPPPLVFPWKRVAVGLAATYAVLTIVGVGLALTASPVELIPPDWVDQTLVAARSVALQWTVVSLLASLVSFRWSMRLVGYRT